MANITEIKLLKDVLGELVTSELEKDKESIQFEKVSNLIGEIQELNPNSSKLLDDLFKEVLALRDIVSEKYIKVGICLERVR